MIPLAEQCFAQAETIKTNDDFLFKIYFLDTEDFHPGHEDLKERFSGICLIKSKKTSYIGGLCEMFAAARESVPDFYIVIHPEIELAKGAIHKIIEPSEFLQNKVIIVGTVGYEDKKNNITVPVFGGRDKSDGIIMPDKVIPVPCHSFDGKFVLIPSFAYSRTGNFDCSFSSTMFAEREYGIRAGKHGVLCALAPGILATLTNHHFIPEWRDKNIPLKQRLKIMKSETGCPPKDAFIYKLKSKNIFTAIFYYIYVRIKFLFPKS